MAGRLEKFKSEQSSSDEGSDEGEPRGGESIGVAGTESEARLLAIKGNSACADCMTSDPVHYPNTPAWGSCNLGCLFCIRCAGIHRKMGVHVSKVLSIRIDTWSEEQLQALEAYLLLTTSTCHLPLTTYHLPLHADCRLLTLQGHGSQRQRGGQRRARGRGRWQRQG